VRKRKEEHSKEKSVRIPARKGLRAHFRKSRAVSDEIKTLGMSDTTMRRIAEEDVRFKSYVNLLLCSLKSRYESDGILRVERY